MCTCTRLYRTGQEFFEAQNLLLTPLALILKPEVLRSALWWCSMCTHDLCETTWHLQWSSIVRYVYMHS
jgi:hypothetical protein